MVTKLVNPRSKQFGERQRKSTCKLACWVFLTLCLFVLQSSKGIGAYGAEPPSGSVELRIQYFSELTIYNVQRGQLRLMNGVFDGLVFATSKLCENETHAELEVLNKNIKKLQVAASAGLNQNRALLNLIQQNLAAANQGSIVAKMKLDLAAMDLAQLTKRTRQTGKQLDQIRKDVIKAEVIYQRALAECLLNDFRSIFGAGGAPVPEPEKDKWPDELLDLGVDGGMEPDSALFLPDFDQLEYDQPEYDPFDRD